MHTFPKSPRLRECVRMPWQCANAQTHMHTRTHSHTRTRAHTHAYTHAIGFPRICTRAPRPKPPGVTGVAGSFRTPRAGMAAHSAETHAGGAAVIWRLDHEGHLEEVYRGSMNSTDFFDDLGYTAFLPGTEVLIMRLMNAQHLNGTKGKICKRIGLGRYEVQTTIGHKSIDVMNLYEYQVVVGSDAISVDVAADFYGPQKPVHGLWCMFCGERLGLDVDSVLCLRGAAPAVGMIMHTCGWTSAITRSSPDPESRSLKTAILITAQHLNPFVYRLDHPPQQLTPEEAIALTLNMASSATDLDLAYEVRDALRRVNVTECVVAMRAGVVAATAAAGSSLAPFPAAARAAGVEAVVDRLCQSLPWPPAPTLTESAAAPRAVRGPMQMFCLLCGNRVHYNGNAFGPGRWVGIVGCNAHPIDFVGSIHMSTAHGVTNVSTTFLSEAQ